jgi:phytanoyl-CoA hydroxylase
LHELKSKALFVVPLHNMPHAVPSESDLTSFNGEKLFVNDGILRPEQVGALKPSSLDLQLTELRRRYNEDGYLFLKGLLPREDVLKAREEYFKMLQPSGVLQPGTAPIEGIFDSSKDPADFPGIGAGAAGGNGKPGGETAARFVDLALEAHYADWYKEKFCKLPVLRDMVARLSGWGEDTFGIRRSLLRNNTPGNKAIGVHYDQIFLRHGEPTSVTAWVPMGDISLTGGGLIYLENGKHIAIFVGPQTHTLGVTHSNPSTGHSKRHLFSFPKFEELLNSWELSVIDVLRRTLTAHRPHTWSRD